MQGRMRRDLYHELYEVENTHWWHHHKRATVHQMVKQYSALGLHSSQKRHAISGSKISSKNKKTILDVGSGTGKILEEFMQKGWRVHGIDGEREAVLWSRKRGVNIRQSDFVNDPLPYSDDAFDVVLALDLLEHIPNDTQVLKEMERVLKPGGIAVVTVPAYQWLFNYWDEMLGHQRRYTTKSFQKIISKNLKTKHLGYYFCLFLIPALCVRLIKQVIGTENSKNQSDFEDTPIPWISIPIMNLYAKAERAMIRFLPLPFGLSVIAVLEKN